MNTTRYTATEARIINRAFSVIGHASPLCGPTAREVAISLLRLLPDGYDQWCIEECINGFPVSSVRSAAWLEEIREACYDDSVIEEAGYR